MSQSNAAAIKRRVNSNQPPTLPSAAIPTRQPAQTSNTIKPSTSNYNPDPFARAGATTGNNAPAPPAGLTLQQVISVMDKRLSTLEQLMQTNGNMVKTNSAATPPQQQAGFMQDVNFTNMIDEFNHRFEILAEELDSMKNIVIKLQSFTMEVNKTLIDERVRIFSEVDVTSQNNAEDLDATTMNETLLVDESNA